MAGQVRYAQQRLVTEGPCRAEIAIGRRLTHRFVSLRWVKYPDTLARRPATSRGHHEQGCGHDFGFQH